MSKGTFGRNFIKELPEGENAAIDESLLSLQFRCRKGSLWEKYFRPWLRMMKGEIDSDELSNVYDSLSQTVKTEEHK